MHCCCVLMVTLNNFFTFTIQTQWNFPDKKNTQKPTFIMLGHLAIHLRDQHMIC